MRLLVTGHKGFVGGHLCDMVPGVAGLDLGGLGVDIAHYPSVLESVSRICPTDVIHLAAQSYVPASFDDPKTTFNVNVLGTLNMLLALRECGFKGRFLYVSSGDTYGAVKNADLPIVETFIQTPRSPYGSSKVAAEVLCKQFSLTESFTIITARPFNHIGPKQSESFVVSGISKKMAEITLNEKRPILSLGNIESTRDFSDVRDVVRAYMDLLSEGVSGDVYNVCSGQETSIREVVAKLEDIVGVKFSIQVDGSRLRKGEQLRVVGCNKKLVQATGWSPKYSLEYSLEDIFQYWLREINK